MFLIELELDSVKIMNNIHTKKSSLIVCNTFDYLGLSDHTKIGWKLGKKPAKLLLFVF